jgi:hypothetical protein
MPFYTRTPYSFFFFVQANSPFPFRSSCDFASASVRHICTEPFSSVERKITKWDEFLLQQLGKIGEIDKMGKETHLLGKFFEYN